MSVGRRGSGRGRESGAQQHCVEEQVEDGEKFPVHNEAGEAAVGEAEEGASREGVSHLVECREGGGGRGVRLRRLRAEVRGEKVPHLQEGTVNGVGVQGERGGRSEWE